MSIKPHIVIIGAGFGGVYVAKHLKRMVKAGLIDVTIINKTNYFLFTPLLHEVATGSQGASNIAEPLREVFLHSGIELCQGVVGEIDHVNRRLHICGEDGNKHTITYDYAVIATGSSTNFYSITGADTHALPVKDLYDVSIIRNKIIDAFESAIFATDPVERQRALTFVVVGGGPTGVEITAELSEFATQIYDRFYSHTKVGHAKIILLSASDALLPRFESAMSKVALERLTSIGVEVRLDAKVRSVSSEGIALHDDSRIESRTVIWTAGVRPNTPQFIGDGQIIGKDGRIAVDSSLKVVGTDRVYALGDVADFVQDGQSLPMLAQVAVREAKCVSYNLLADIKNKKSRAFKYHSQGLLVSLGNRYATGLILGRVIKGIHMWILWRTVYVSKFASSRRRIRIALEWFVLLFLNRDITKYGLDKDVCND